MPNIHLTPQMQAFAEAEVARGAYANVSEVVRAGMRKLMEENAADLQAFLDLRAELERRAAEPTVDADAVFDRLFRR